MNAEELGAFLRTRRRRLQPTDVGLPPGGGRRADGLRREEVAVLAGIGVSWLARVEQGRGRGVSEQVLARLAEVLRLDAAERAHLLGLAGFRTPASASAAPVQAAHHALVEGLTPHPAYLLDTRWDMVVTNAAERALFPPVVSDAAPRNLLRLVFGHPELRSLMLDWEQEAVRLAHQFRLHLSAHPHAEGQALVQELRRDSAEFAAAWDNHDVAAFTSTLRLFDHPRAGRLAFDHHRLALLDRPGWQLVVYLEAAGTNSTGRLAQTLRGAGQDPDSNPSQP